MWHLISTCYKQNNDLLTSALTNVRPNEKTYLKHSLLFTVQVLQYLLENAILKIRNIIRPTMCMHWSLASTYHVLFFYLKVFYDILCYLKYVKYTTVTYWSLTYLTYVGTSVVNMPSHPPLRTWCRSSKLYGTVRPYRNRSPTRRHPPLRIV